MVYIHLLSYHGISIGSIYDHGLLVEYQELYFISQTKSTEIPLNAVNPDPILKIEYNHSDYNELLGYYSRVLKTRYQDDVLELPEYYGKGFMKLLTLPNGLSCILGNYSVHQDTIFHRKRDNKNFFVLRFDELSEGEQRPDLSSKSAVCLTNTSFDWLLYETKGAKIRSLKVQISEDWLNGFLKNEPSGEQIRKFLALKTSAFNYEPMDKEYKLLLNHVLYPECDERFHLLYQQNRIMLLVERFFTNLARRLNGLPDVSKITTGDIERIKEAEEALLADLTKALSIDMLAKKIMLSQSRLKDGFRELYGMSIYQYFQKHRMQKAKAMLLSRKYTVREVGKALGYESMNSFTKAFQKVFDQLPSEIHNDAIV